MNRRAKDETQQRILEEQSQLVLASKPKDAEDIEIPDIVVPKETIEVAVSYG